MRSGLKSPLPSNLLSEDASIFTCQMNLRAEIGKKVLLAMQMKSPTDIQKEIKIYIKQIVLQAFFILNLCCIQVSRVGLYC